MPANMENSAVATGLEKVSFHSNPKERQCQRMLKLPHNCISHTSKVLLKILQARLQQYVNYELPDVQAGFRKCKGTRDQIVNICWIIEKAREFQKNIYFCFIYYAKYFDCVDHNKLWKIMKEMGIPDHLSCLLRNLYAGQEAIVRTGHGTTEWFQKEYINAVSCHCAYVTYMQNQFGSVAQLCLTFCSLMNCSTPGLPVHHQLPESIQTSVLPMNTED